MFAPRESWRRGTVRWFIALAGLSFFGLPETLADDFSDLELKLEVRRERGQLERMESLLLQMEQLQPNNPKVLYDLGELYGIRSPLHDPAKATAHFEHFLDATKNAGRDQERVRVQGLVFDLEEGPVELPLSKLIPAAAQSGKSTASSTAKDPDAIIGEMLTDMIEVEPGTFRMGSPLEERKRFSDEKPHTVSLTQSYKLGRCEVTQAQWEAVMGENPSHFKDAGPNAPVEKVSWDEAMAFCEKLNEREKAAGRLPEGYRYTLPTEAQWEFACRAGTSGPYAGSLDAMAWYAKDRMDGSTHAVGERQANAWGFKDVHGNVWEWCYDRYAEHYPEGRVTDPKGAETGDKRAYRGGSWISDARSCRSAVRNRRDSDFSYYSIGFRLCLAPER